MPKTNIHILCPEGELDYYDSRSISLPVSISALDAWNLITGQRNVTLRTAFRIRDAISSRFGVKRIGGFSVKWRDHVEVGDYLDFFLVEHAAPDVLVLTERDRHLDVMTCISILNQRLTITASVVTHNRFGRAYMTVVGPAHKLVVHRMLQNLKRHLDDADTI